MSEMIERVARALQEFYGGPVPIEAARAAIEAMREPTDVMDRAGDLAILDAAFGSTVWDAMISAALS